MSIERRIQRFRRLAGLDQLRLERAAAELIAANEARSKAGARLDQLRDEYSTTLASCEGIDLAQRRQTSLWADWSRREQDGAAVDLEKKTTVAEVKRQAVLLARRRTKSWSRLLQRLDRQLQSALVKRDYAGADELAVRQHWLGHAQTGQRAGSVSDGTGRSDYDNSTNLSNRQSESAANQRLELYP